ncbi:hypothetical protein H4R33_005007 [Dimargaris cristalligena]|nr:hypothetical protein H4R33_005007 [Dimargaris cristalligena]
MRFTSFTITVCVLGLMALSFANASLPGHDSDADFPGHDRNADNRSSGKNNMSPHSRASGENNSDSDHNEGPHSGGPNGPDRH